jgi:hypothetical protein
MRARAVCRRRRKGTVCACVTTQTGAYSELRVAAHPGVEFLKANGGTMATRVRNVGAISKKQQQ